MRMILEPSTFGHEVNPATECRCLAQRERWVNGSCGCDSPHLDKAVPTGCPRGKHQGDDHTLITDEKTEAQRGELTSLRSPCPLELEQSRI